MNTSMTSAAIALRFNCSCCICRRAHLESRLLLVGCCYPPARPPGVPCRDSAHSCSASSTRRGSASVGLIISSQVPALLNNSLNLQRRISLATVCGRLGLQVDSHDVIQGLALIALTSDLRWAPSQGGAAQRPSRAADLHQTSSAALTYNQQVVLESSFWVCEPAFSCRPESLSSLAFNE